MSEMQSGRGAARTSCVEIRHDGPVLVLGGDLDVRSTFEVRAALHDHLAAFEGAADVTGEVVVDISGVHTADATALKVLAAASRRASRHGLRMVLRGASPAVRRMLHLTHLIRLVELDRELVPA
ncbi:STAS domain-containing protein [Nocardioides sp. SYSU DS0651]|uniref:STAS domain-containing protein n=1 Tax=Nocardioides sp. SYSU DS0651 TaxID=3415955 RepID=UPI003F4C6324